MPDSLLIRANEILNEYENKAKKKQSIEKVQLSMDFFSEDKKDDVFMKKIEGIDLMNTTPIEALNLLYELKEEMKKAT